MLVIISLDPWPVRAVPVSGGGFEPSPKRIYHFHNAPCLLPPQKHNLFFYFSWDDCNTQEKLGTMVMQTFGGKQGTLWSI